MDAALYRAICPLSLLEDADYILEECYPLPDMHLVCVHKYFNTWLRIDSMDYNLGCYALVPSCQSCSRNMHFLPATR